MSRRHCQEEYLLQQIIRGKKFAQNWKFIISSIRRDALMNDEMYEKNLREQKINKKYQ